MAESKQMNKWTPTTDRLTLRRMGKLIEELGEAQAVAARVIIQGIDEVDPGSGKVNRQRLMDELADVQAQISCTVQAFDLDRHSMSRRIADKTRQMAEWEAMFQPQEPGAPWSPRVGDLVRYGDGSTALALHGEPHAGGWHGTQCMGGYTFYSTVYQPTVQDRKMWVQCAIKWRHMSLTTALAEAGLCEKLELAEALRAGQAEGLTHGIEALQADAARYRWLRDKLTRILVTGWPDCDDATDGPTVVREIRVGEHFRLTDPASTDAAVDAARNDAP